MVSMVTEVQPGIKMAVVAKVSINDDRYKGETKNQLRHGNEEFKKEKISNHDILQAKENIFMTIPFSSIKANGEMAVNMVGNEVRILVND